MITLLTKFDSVITYQLWFFNKKHCYMFTQYQLTKCRILDFTFLYLQ